MSAGALAGIRVLDLTRLLPGGLCTLLLADLGADVVKIEAPPDGDYLRDRMPAAFAALNRNKRSVQLDLKTPLGKDALLRLAGTADVLVESFRPGVLERLGVGYETLRAANPRLVYCALTGWGQTGPLASRAGHDIDYLAAVGALSLTGRPEEEPLVPAVQVADSAGGVVAAFAILAAIQERSRSGEGQLVDVSLAHAALALLAGTAAGVLESGTAEPRTHAPLSGGLACYRTYRCADGWVALGALEPKFWEAWCRGVGREDLVEHHGAAGDSEIAAETARIFAGRSRSEWEAFAAEHDCCLAPVRGVAEALDSPLVRERGGLGSPVRLSRTPPDVSRREPPALGEHTSELLREVGLEAS